MKQVSRKRIQKAENWWNMQPGRKYLFPLYMLIGDIYAGYLKDRLTGKIFERRRTNHWGKQFNLSEEEQKDLFCMAWHLQSLIEDAKYHKTASFGKPCSTCKFMINGKDCDLDFYGKSNVLTELTGVKFTTAIYKYSLENSNK